MKKLLTLMLLSSVLVLAACNLGGNQNDEHTHEASAAWASDATNHWHTCSGCDELLDQAAHTFGEWEVVTEATEVAAGERSRECSVCAYKQTEEIAKLEHTHEYTWETKTPATCTEAEVELGTCSCGATEERAGDAALGHSFGSELKKDAENHWYECECGAKDQVTPHTWDEGTTTLEPTVEAEGKMEYTCTACEQTKEVVLDKLVAYTLTGNVKNVFDGALDGVKVSLGGEEIATTTEGVFTISNVLATPNYVLTFEKAGYVTLTQDFTSLLTGKEVNVNLGDVDLARDYVRFGALEPKSWTNQEAFVGYVTRNSNGMLFRMEASNAIFTSEGRNSKLELYVSVGSNVAFRDGNAGVTQIVIFSNKSHSVFNYGNGDLDSKLAMVTVDDTNGKTVVEVAISYQALGMVSYDEIMGVNMGLWSVVDDDWNAMFALDTNTPTNVEQLTTYVRNDGEGCFISERNDDFVPTYNKAEVIADREYGFADPVLVKMTNADDIYFKVLKDETGFTFDMVGFGTFDDNEVIKLVLHTSEVDGSVWALQASDVTFLISKTKATLRVGTAEFFDYITFDSNDVAAKNAPVYNLDASGYFSLTFKVDFTEIPEYSETCEVSMLMVEFGINQDGNYAIFNNDPWINAMTYKGVGIGDPANQVYYQVIQEKPTSVDKEALLESYTIQFSTNYYAKFEKTAETLKLHILSFAGLTETDTIRFAINADGVNDGGWVLGENDVIFNITRTSAFYTTGAYAAQTRNDNFWACEFETPKFWVGGFSYETINTPVFTEEAEYRTLTLEIDYTEIGLEITENTPLTGMLVTFAGNAIQNSGFVYNGLPGADIALQANYFTIA